MGYVSTACAIAYIYQDDPRRAIAAAAASGGDTDTVASIVGAIVGARCGLEALDPEWIQSLKARDDVERAIELLTKQSPGVVFPVERRPRLAVYAVPEPMLTKG